jgi:TonB family protein
LAGEYPSTADTDSSNERVLESATIFRPIRFLLISLLLTILGLTPTTPARSQDQPNAVTLTAQQEDQLRDLAGRVLEHSDKAGCRKSDCTILVTNFIGPTGSTSALGMQLADTLASQLVAQTNGIRIVDRSSLQIFLERERISSRLLGDDRAAGWLASELHASAVLVGALNPERIGVHLRVTLLNAQDALKKEKKKKDTAPIEEKILSIENPDAALAPAEPFANISPADTASLGKEIFRAGVNGVTQPRCFYQPDPQYSEAARSVKFQGTVILDMTIMLDERIGEINVVRGIPFGLNEAARKSAATWQCKPASREGTIVPTTVNVEITFRLF